VSSVTALPGPRGVVMQICAEDNCVNEVVSGRCEEHQRKVVRPAGQYDRHWRIRRAAYLRKHPRCECDECMRLPEAKRPIAVDVHHRHGEGPAGGNRDVDLQSMAHGHHSRVTARSRWSR